MNPSTAEILSGIPARYDTTIAVDDLPGAYTGIPLMQDDIRAAIVAVCDEATSGWLFAEY